MSNRPPYSPGELVALGSCVGFYRNTYGIILNEGDLVMESYYEGGFIGDGYWYFDVLVYDGSVERVRENLIFEYSPAKESFQESLQSGFGDTARRQHAKSRNIVQAHKAILAASRASQNAEVWA